MDNLWNIDVIKAILSRHGFSFSKSLGQNFITDPNVCPTMADCCNIDENTGVIEVGPGIGVLTNVLCKRAKKVVSVELDKRLLPILKETMAEYSNFEVINNDILEIDLNKLIEDKFSGMEVVICANLPYYITSPVIMKILESRVNIKCLTVMVQKEAAERICAAPGTKNCGAISGSVCYYSKPQLMFHVTRDLFVPSPNVDSAVIRLDINKEPPVIANEKYYFQVVKGAFAQRRKTLVNSLSSVVSIGKDNVSNLITSCGLSPSVRGEQLTIDDFANLSLKLADYYKKNNKQ